MRCTSCRFANPEGTKLCIDCGSPLTNRCPHCEHENLPRAKFCGECGASLTAEVQGLKSQVQSRESQSGRAERAASAGERRQLTVMFCDLVGSSALSAQLDPEELREVVRAYQEACAAVIRRYEGHIAQYLGDGQRAVRVGLGILAGLQHLNSRLQLTVGATHASPLQLRIGIHTGLVVVGEMGDGDKRELLALGETPNIAARVQGEAEPNTVVISTATYRLVQGLFECHDLGPRTLKGLSTPLSLYRVVGESAAQSRFEVAVRTGLTPLVGRDLEVGLLRERWAQAKGGDGQVVLLSGEAGIGKSRLVQALKEQVIAEGA